MEVFDGGAKASADSACGLHAGRGVVGRAGLDNGGFTPRAFIFSRAITRGGRFLGVCQSDCGGPTTRMAGGGFCPTARAPIGFRAPSGQGGSVGSTGRRTPRLAGALLIFSASGTGQVFAGARRVSTVTTVGVYGVKVCRIDDAVRIDLRDGGTRREPLLVPVTAIIIHEGAL